MPVATGDTPAPRTARRPEMLSYTLLGVVFGFCFPIGSLLYLYYAGLAGAGAEPGLVAFLAQAHREQPLLYVIDSAPLFLGLLAYLAGERQYRLRRLSESLEAEVKAKTEDLRAALEETRRANETITAMAQQDPLTLLFNRRRFQQELDRAVRHARRYGRELALLFFDLDGFKRINDRAGHEEGDRYLLAVAEVLGKNLRATDIAARWGGDEFALLLPETGTAGAEEVAKKLLAAMRRQKVAIKGEIYVLYASIGIAVFPTHARTPEDLLRRADAAMYEAKRAGGCTWRVSRPAVEEE